MPFFSTKIEATLPKCISCQRMSDKRVKWKILSAYKCGVLYWNWIQRFLNKTFDRNCGVLLKTFVCFFFCCGWEISLENWFMVFFYIPLLKRIIINSKIQLIFLVLFIKIKTKVCTSTTRLCGQNSILYERQFFLYIYHVRGFYFNLYTYSP